MERLIKAVSRCTSTYSKLRYMRELQRSCISTSSSRLGRFEPDDLKLEPDIPEYSSLNVRLHSYDFVLLDGFAKHVLKMASYCELEADGFVVPALKQDVQTLKPRSKLKQDLYHLNRYERVVQLNSVPSPKLPVFLEFVRNNCPQSVTVTVKEATEEDEEFLYVPDLEKLKITQQLAEMTSDKKR